MKNALRAQARAVASPSRLACWIDARIAAHDSLAARGTGIAPCHFEPHCGTYAREAVGRFGVLRGLGLGLARVMRCRRERAGKCLSDPVPMRMGIALLRASTDAELALTEAIRVRIRKLPDAQQRVALDYVAKHGRACARYMALCFAFATGLHHAYLGRYRRAVLVALGFAVGSGCLLLTAHAGLRALGAGVILLLSPFELFELARAEWSARAYERRVHERALDAALRMPPRIARHGLR